MKTLLALTFAAVIGLAFAVPAHAADPAYGVVKIFVSTNTIPIPAQGATNLATPRVIDVRKQAKVALQLYSIASAATTDNITFYIRSSVDGLTYSTAARTVALAMTGATALTTVTNLDTYGAGYLRLDAISNAAATATVDGCYVSYGVKISAP